MTDNRSLDEFTGDDSSSEVQSEPVPVDDKGNDQGPGDPGESEARGPTEGAETAASEVVPMEETFAWSVTGRACTNCGELVEERWREEDTLVCADCKAW